MTNDGEQSAIDAVASDWIVRLSGPDVTREEREAFEQWLAIDPRHGETYDALSRTWEDIGSLRALGEFVDPTPAKPALRRWGGAFVDLLGRPGAVSGGFVVAAAAAMALYLAPSLFDRPEFATQIAEVRPVELPDGSLVTLGARSEIDVNFTDGERRVVLRSGEAFFEVARNPNRPFFVEAGGTTVRVVGTKFDVRRGDERVGVSVLEGVVQVSNRGDPAVQEGDGLRILRAGERLDVEQRSVLFAAPAPLPVVEQVRAAPAGAWREGRLSYDDAPLSELVADVNRYYAPGVRLLSRDVGSLRVTAAFRTDQIPQFLDALGAVLPVEVSQGGDSSFSIGARPQN